MKIQKLSYKNDAQLKTYNYYLWQKLYIITTSVF